MNGSIETVDVDNLYAGVSIESPYWLLKCRLVDGAYETLFFPSTPAHWLLRELRNNTVMKKQPMPLSQKPDIASDDWDGNSDEHVVTKIQAIQFSNCLMIFLIMANQRKLALRFFPPQSALLLHYLRNAEMYLSDVTDNAEGNA